MIGRTTRATVEARVHRLFGPGDRGEPLDSRSPYLVALDSIEEADDVARGFRMSRGVIVFWAADDGFGNLLRVPS